jgi:hypothetical protein
MAGPEIEWGTELAIEKPTTLYEDRGAGPVMEGASRIPPHPLFFKSDHTPPPPWGEVSGIPIPPPAGSDPPLPELGRLPDGAPRLNYPDREHPKRRAILRTSQDRVGGYPAYPPTNYFSGAGDPPSHDRWGGGGYPPCY